MNENDRRWGLIEPVDGGLRLCANGLTMELMSHPLVGDDRAIALAGAETHSIFIYDNFPVLKILLAAAGFIRGPAKVNCLCSPRTMDRAVAEMAGYML